jgi:hypothetical protein
MKSVVMPELISEARRHRKAGGEAVFLPAFCGFPSRAWRCQARAVGAQKLFCLPLVATAGFLSRL